MHSIVAVIVLVTVYTKTINTSIFQTTQGRSHPIIEELSPARVVDNAWANGDAIQQNACITRNSIRPSSINRQVKVALCSEDVKVGDI